MGRRNHTKSKDMELIREQNGVILLGTADLVFGPRVQGRSSLFDRRSDENGQWQDTFERKGNLPSFADMATVPGNLQRTLFFMDTEEMQNVCGHLDEFALPRAVVDFNRRHFVAWNKKFLARTGYSEEEIRALEPANIIVEGELSFFPADEADNPTARFFPVAVRVPATNSAVPGHLIRPQGNFGYLMLGDIDPAASTKFEQGRLVGQEQERGRVVRAFHDEISAGILGALFKIQMAKQRLESAESPESKPVTEASEMLSEAVKKMDDLLENKKEDPRTDA